MNPDRLATVRRWEEAVRTATDDNRALQRAFVVEHERVQPQPDVYDQSFSSTESMLVGLLMELWSRAHGLDPTLIPSAKKLRGDVGAGEFFWKGAPAAADLFACLDERQLRVILELLPRSCLAGR